MIKALIKKVHNLNNFVFTHNTDEIMQLPTHNRIARDENLAAKHLAMRVNMI